jgi:hypothetical protein
MFWATVGCDEFEGRFEQRIWNNRIISNGEIASEMSISHGKKGKA